MQCRGIMKSEKIARVYTKAATGQAHIDTAPGGDDISGLNILKIVSSIPNKLYADLILEKNLVQAIRCLG